jgi:hypothetical protein
MGRGGGAPLSSQPNIEFPDINLDEITERLNNLDVLKRKPTLNLGSPGRFNISPGGY